MPASGFRYATSPDGTSIAYTRLGTGPALVVVPPVPFSNVSGDMAVPLMAEVYGALARDFELILYDGRGTGASQRGVSDLSTEALRADLAAVLDDAGLKHAALLAMYLAVPPALRFAADQPDRVTQLLLLGAVRHGGTALKRPGTAALLSLIDEDWDLFTRTAALDWMGWGVGAAGEQVASSFRTGTTPAVARAALAAYAETDVSPDLPKVKAPTLVLHRRDGRQISLEESAALAASLPEGRLHVLDGTSATLFFDDAEGTIDLIRHFIRPDSPTRPVPSPEAAQLSPRQREVLRLIAGGESNAEIAATLGLSVHTVERHAADIYRKIGARGRADATAWALRSRLD